MNGIEKSAIFIGKCAEALTNVGSSDFKDDKYICDSGAGQIESEENSREVWEITYLLAIGRNIRIFTLNIKIGRVCDT